jgi:hypothetical protein
LDEWSTNEPLSMLAFGSRQQIGFKTTYAIERKERPWFRYPVGAIILQKGGCKKDAIVNVYLAVMIGSATTFEGLAYFNSPNRLTFYHNGLFFGELLEIPQDVDKPTSLWTRFFRKKRLWNVIVGKECCGDVLLQYPVNNKNQIFFRLKNDVKLPISYGYRCNIVCDGGTPMAPFRGLLGALTGFGNSDRIHGDMIIPLNTPRYSDVEYTQDVDIDRMHFLLNIIFRSYYLAMDFAGVLS